MHQSDTLSLFDAARRGDQAAFTEIYERYYTPLFRFIYVKVSDADVAEDLTQAVFTKIYRNLGSLKNPLTLGYFYAAARTAVIDYYRASNHRPIQASEEVLETLKDDRPGIRQELIEQESTEAIHQLIAELPDDQQEVIMLRFIQGASGAETARQLGKTEAATRQLQTRAIKALRRQLGTNHEDI